MSALGQRLVPIRPSPQRGISSGKGVTVLSGGGTQSPVTLTPPKTGIKRKYDEDSDDESETESCKRRINFAVDYVCSPQPVSISRRNARERNRVKQVNNGFAALRQHIPGAAKAKKISKVDTLKQAVEYIQNLQKLLQENDDALMKEMKEEYFQFHLPTSSNDSQSQQNTDSFGSLTSPSIPHTSTSLQMPHFYFDENISPASSAYGSNVMSPESASIPMSPTVPISSPYFPLPTQQQQQQKQQNNHQHDSSSVPSQPYTTFAATNGLFDLSLLPLSQRSGHNSSQTASLSRLAYQRHEPQLPTIPEHATLTRSLEPTEPTPSSMPTQVQNSPTIPSRPHLDRLAIRTAALERSPVSDVRLPILESSVTNLLQSTINDPLGSPPSYGSPTDSTYSSTPLYSVYASPPAELTPPDITNIDSAITSNFIPSLAHMMEAYDPAIDPTSPTEVEDGDSLDAIDLWEKC